MAVSAEPASAIQPMPLALRRAAPRYMLTVQELEANPPPASARAAILLALVMLGGFIAWSLYFPVAERARAGGDVEDGGDEETGQRQSSGERGLRHSATMPRPA